MFVAKSNISIINCTFVNNSAEIGGAILYSTSYVLNNISIGNNIFISNKVAVNHNIQDCS